MLISLLQMTDLHGRQISCSFYLITLYNNLHIELSFAEEIVLQILTTATEV